MSGVSVTLAPRDVDATAFAAADRPSTTMRHMPRPGGW
jgi:hypothetical protein